MKNFIKFYVLVLSFLFTGFAVARDIQLNDSQYQDLQKALGAQHSKAFALTSAASSLKYDFSNQRRLSSSVAGAFTTDKEFAIGAGIGVKVTDNVNGYIMGSVIPHTVLNSDGNTSAMVGVGLSLSF